MKSAHEKLLPAFFTQHTKEIIQFNQELYFEGEMLSL
jgi:hypothetical protein